MKMKWLRIAVKGMFRAIGLDLHRIDPSQDNYAWLDQYEIRTILDIGANTGQSSQFFRKVASDAYIHAFEPLKGCYETLVSTMAGDPCFRAWNIALGDSDSTEDMHRSEFHASSSLLPMGDLHKESFPYTSQSSIETVEVRRLDTVAETLDLRDNLFIKIDVQGYEKSVIQGGMKTVARAKVLILETTFQELYVGQALFPEIYDMLRPMGFVFMGCLSDLRSPVNGSVLHGDSLFIREPGL